MTEGPFLYDDGPSSPHTGTPRPRRGLVLALFGGTVAVAVALALALPLVRGTAEEQAREVAVVFLAALAQDDIRTAHELLCEDERARVPPEQVPAEYDAAAPGEIAGITGDEVDGRPVQRVRVRWADGGTTTLTVVGEGGPRVCGTG